MVWVGSLSLMSWTGWCPAAATTQDSACGPTSCWRSPSSQQHRQQQISAVPLAQVLSCRSCSCSHQQQQQRQVQAQQGAVVVVVVLLWEGLRVQVRQEQQWQLSVRAVEVLSSCLEALKLAAEKR